MKRTLLATLWCLAPAAALPAQEPANAATEVKISKAARAHQTLEADLKAERKAYSSRLRELRKTDKYKELRKAKDYDALRELSSTIEKVDEGPFVERATAACEAFAGTPEEVDFLSFLAMNVREDKAARDHAIDAILADHITSPRIEDFVGRLWLIARDRKDFDVNAAYATIIEKNPSALVKAHALYSRARMTLRDKSASDEAKDAANADIATAGELAKGTPLGWRIEGPEFVKNNLQVGMVAPDIEGVDLDGVPFKLSDYRGKVVVLDFWGDW